MTEYNTDEIALQVKQGKADSGALWESVKRFAYQQAALFYNNRKETGRYMGYELDDLLQEAFFAMLQALDWWDHTSFGFLTAYRYLLKTTFAAVSGTRTKGQRKDPIRNAVWIDGPAPGIDVGDKKTLGEAVPDPDAAKAFAEAEAAIWQQELSAAVQTCLAGLHPLQQQVLHERYWNERTRKEVAAILGLKEANTKRIEKRALQALRYGKHIKVLRPFVLEEITWRYSTIGLQAFKNTWTSAPELAVINLERLEAVQRKV